MAVSACASRRVWAVLPQFTRKLYSARCVSLACSSPCSTRKTPDQRRSLPSGAAPVRPYSATTQDLCDDGEDDVLYKTLVVEVKGHDPTVINSYQQFLTMAARELEINVTDVSTPPRVIERYTQLKSVHIYKKHRVQYETRTHFKTFTIKHITGSTADTFLEYIQRNLPEGMAMKVTKHRIEALPSHLRPPPSGHDTKSQPETSI